MLESISNGSIVGQTGFFCVGKATKSSKRTINFQPVVLHLKIELVSVAEALSKYIQEDDVGVQT